MFIIFACVRGLVLADLGLLGCDWLRNSQRGVAIMLWIKVEHGMGSVKACLQLAINAVYLIFFLHLCA